jgi:hypothetical protein
MKSNKKDSSYTKGLPDREIKIKMGIPSQKDMDALIEFEEKGKKPVPKPKRKPKPPTNKKMKKGGKVGRGCGAALRGGGKVMK